MLVLLTVVGLAGFLPGSVVLAVFGITVSFGTGGVFAVVPLLFPDRPGTTAGFIGGISTGGGIVYPLIYGAVPNIHLGYAAVAIGIFVPLTAFFLWAMRYEGNLAAHGIGSRERWLAPDSTASGGDD